MRERAELIKIRLHDQGENVETPWAADLGPIADVPRRRR
ncbi:Hypothetical protein A7982_01688 [Minicystis rosea]|nr:Hypothetical protein A7982_01688 [Minicystis rosea]